MNRRGACPGFSSPMATGDGLLARLHPAGPLPLSAVAGLCDAAEMYGNGLLEVTQRGSLQVRGLRAEGLAGFRSDIEALDFDAPEGVVVQTPPLSRDSLPIAASLREALDRSGISSRIAPKTTVILDAGDGLPIDALIADIRLRVVGNDLHLGLGESPVAWVGSVALLEMNEVVLGLLQVLAAAGPSVRVRDLGAAPFRMAIGGPLTLAAAPPPRGTADAVGCHAAAVGIGLPFGAVGVEPLRLLLTSAAGVGAERVWAAPGRALIFESLPTDAAEVVAEAAAAWGFVVDPDDPRRRVHACTGAPGCASARQPVRALAQEVSRAVAGLLDAGEGIHLSGCPKGCAHAAAAAITLVGWEEGFRLILDGRADDTPIASLGPSEILTKLPDLLEKRRRVPVGAVARGFGAGRG